MLLKKRKNNLILTIDEIVLLIYFERSLLKIKGKKKGKEGFYITCII